MYSFVHIYQNNMAKINGEYWAIGNEYSNYSEIGET